MSLEVLDIAIATYRVNVINRIERDDVTGAIDLLLNMNFLLNKHKRLKMDAPRKPDNMLSTIFQRMEKQWLRENLVAFEEHYAELLRSKSLFSMVDSIIEFYRKAIISRRDHEELLDACYLQLAQIKMLPEDYRDPKSKLAASHFTPIPAKGAMMSGMYNKALENWLAKNSREFERVYQQWKQIVSNQYRH